MLRATIVSGLAAALVATLGAGPAMAGTLSYDQVTGTLTYTGTPGTADDLTLGAGADDAGTTSVELQAAAGTPPPAAGAGCTPAVGGGVTCTPAPRRVRIYLGDRADRISVRYAAPGIQTYGPTPSVRRYPGPGVPDTVVEGGSGNDRVRVGGLLAGPAETVDGFTVLGGAGNDRVAVIEEPTDLEILSGTMYVFHNGMSGRLTFGGGGGDDRATGGDYPDALNGGSGRDYLAGGGGRDVIDCGSGRDQVKRGKGDRIRRCERLVRR